MFSILDRYLAREIIQTLLGVTVVLLFIFISNRLVRYLADAAAGELPADVIFILLALKATMYLILLLPLALFLGIMLVQGRMCQDSEMTAVSACGVGMIRLYKPVFMLALPLTIIVGWMSFYAVPWITKVEYQVLQSVQKNLEVTGITSGQFRKIGTGRVIYVEQIEQEGQEMKNLFIHVTQAGKRIMLSSERGYLQQDEKNGDHYLVMLDGNRYEGEPGHADFKIIEFKKHTLLIDTSRPAGLSIKNSATSTSDLWTSISLNDKAELQWRISIPLSVIVLALLALPLGHIDPRKGRYGKLFAGILIYIVYVNVLAIAQSWVQRGHIPTVMGLWWVHILMLILAAVILVRYYGVEWVRYSWRQKENTK